MSRTVADLLEEMRSQLDETNTANATPEQLLATLNRGQRMAVNIISRKYKDLLWSSATITTTGGTRAYAIPDEAHGRRIAMAYVLIGETAYPLTRIDNHRKAQYISGSQSSRPAYYTLVKNEIELFPLPSAGLTVYLCYVDRPERLVLPQGRITSVNSGSNYVILDEIAEDTELSTATTDFACYVNFIDYNTGAVKGSAQINAINAETGQVTFKTTGLTRSSVLGKTIATAIPDDLEADDYVCLVTGTCVSELPDDFTDALIQHGVVATRRRFGEATQEEYAAFKDELEELAKMWAGQTARNRVKKVSNSWRHGASAIRLLS